jgi:hypothetical protein
LGYLQQKMIEEKVMSDEVMKWQRLAEDAERDLDVVVAFANEFVVRALENMDMRAIRSAAYGAVENSGCDASEVAEILDRLGLCDPELCKREYEVTLTYPVEITVTVEATDEDEAVEAAAEEVRDNGIDSYAMDYDYSDYTDPYAREV